MANATLWPKMIRAVYDSFDTGRHQGDATARRVMDRAVSWLCAGLELSPRLQAKLIDNINMRTKFTAADPGEPIRLSRGQLDHIKRTNPEWMSLGLAGEDLPAENLLKDDALSAEPASVSPQLQQVFSNLSASIQQSFSVFSALFQHEAMALAQHLVSIAAEKGGPGTAYCSNQDPKVMEREEKRINPGDGMIGLSPVLASHDRQEPEALLGDLHEPQADDLQDAYRGVGGSHGQEAMARRDDDGDVEKSEPADARVIVSFFHNDPDAPPSANLEVDGETFALVFSDVDQAEQKLREVAEPSWLDDLEASGGAAIRLESRRAGQHKTRCRMSPLYAATDRFAYKAPVVGNAVAVLSWNEDHQPESVTLVSGQDVVVVPLSKFYGRTAKAPTHKGSNLPAERRAA